VITQQDIETSVIAALISAGSLVILRLARGGSIQNALSGIFGVLFAAWLARRSGNAEDFFLPGILWNIGYASAMLFSIAIRRPLVGYLIEGLSGGALDWRTNRAKLKNYTLLTWVWFAVFTTRVAIMLPLYFASEIELLGVLKLVLGWPLFAMGLWVSFKLNRENHERNSELSADS
jgi:hypothetical protein